MDLHALQHTLVSQKAEIVKQLGLDDLAASTSKFSAGIKRRRPQPDVSDWSLLRRSSRSLQRVDYTESALLDRQTRASNVEFAGAAKRISGLESEEYEEDRSVKPGGINLPAPPPPGSLKTLEARIGYMQEMYLGKHVPIALGGPGNQAKRAVMNESCAKAGTKPVFSRMTGIQEWCNAIFLFVNLGKDSSNEFQAHGKLINWFAQNRQSEASAQVQRLIHHATGVQYPSRDILPSDVHDIGETAMLPACAVALICRLEGEPYVWCGELEYVSHDRTSHPLKFTWRLKDYEILSKQELFIGLVNSGE